MKKKKMLLIIAIIFSLNSFSQGIKPAPEGKAVVYFVRLGNMVGALKNFSVFDGEKILGKLKSGQYIRYECEPGTHIFWAKSDNKDFIEGELIAGKNYIIKVIPRESQVTVNLKLQQVSSTKKSIKLINKKAPKEFKQKDLDAWTKSKAKMMQKTMEKYKAKKKKGKRYNHLKKELFYQDL